MSAVALKYVPDPPVVPPGEDELPYDFGPPMESEVHWLQMVLLVEVLRQFFADRDDVCVAGNMAIYYSELQVKKNDFRGPDVFVVFDTVKRKRKSWVVWQEERTPDLVIELLSDGTEHIDRGEKMRIYARAMHVPEYYLFDPLDGRFEAYRLDSTTMTYQRQDVLPGAPVWSDVLGLRFEKRAGLYQGVDNDWLRLVRPDGTLVLTGEEQAQLALRRAEQAESERDGLLALLRASGVDPASALSPRKPLS